MGFTSWDSKISHVSYKFVRGDKHENKYLQSNYKKCLEDAGVLMAQRRKRLTN